MKDLIRRHVRASVRFASKIRKEAFQSRVRLRVQHRYPFIGCLRY
jgi:hypothetical protein